MGSLTQIINLPIGSSVGQISEANPHRANYLAYSGDFAPPPWAHNGGSVVTDQAFADQIDAGYILQAVSAPNGNVSNISQGIATPSLFGAGVISTGAINVFRTVNGVNITSAQCTLSMIFGGGPGGGGTLVFNPSSGQLLNTTGAIISAVATPFVAQNQNGVNVSGIRFAMTVSSQAGNNSLTFSFLPQSNGGAAGSVFAGGAQVELGAQATSFISSSPLGFTNQGNAVGIRYLGKQPYQVAPVSMGTEIITTNYPINPVTDKGICLLVAANGLTITLPFIGDPLNPVIRRFFPGDYVDIMLDTSVAITNLLIDNGGGNNIFAPGLTSGGTGVSQLTIPSGSVNPRIFNGGGVRVIAGNGQWNVFPVGTVHGEEIFTGNGNFIPGGAESVIAADGTGGGGGGGGSAATGASGGGGGAQAIKDKQFSVTPGTAVAITIGTGGNGGAAGANNGVAGTNTIIGALQTLNGGNFGFGAAGASNSIGGARGGTGGVAGQQGSVGSALGGMGGGTIFAAPTPSDFNAQRDGAIYGGGGSGNGTNGGAGGIGASGIVVIKW